MNYKNGHLQVKTRLLDSVKSVLRARLSPAEFAECEPFLDIFWAQLAINDWVDKDPADIAGCCYSLWVALHEAYAEPVIRVFNPTLEEHGWLSNGSCLIVRQTDMPFLVDSLRLELNRQGQSVRLIKSTVLKAERGEDGRLRSVSALGSASPKEDLKGREALIYMELGKLGQEELSDIAGTLRKVLAEVAVVVGDYPLVMSKIRQVTDNLSLAADQGRAEEAQAFLRWLQENHFTFLGLREFYIQPAEPKPQLCEKVDERLGVFKPLKNNAAEECLDISDAVADFYRSEALVAFSKAGTRSRVHRDAYPDYIVVKRFSDTGELIGEVRLLGLFTYSVYTLSPRQIPIIRKKVAAITERSGLLPYSHDGKNLSRVLETFPRDELFQSDFDTLYNNVLGVAWINERRVIKLLTRTDPFGKFVNCLVYIPRDVYNTRIRQKIEQIIAGSINARGYESTTYFSESILARLQIIFRIDDKAKLDFDTLALEEEIVAATRGWDERFEAALIDKFGEYNGLKYARLYGGAFSAGYQESFDARNAVRDIEFVERLQGHSDIATHFFHPIGENDNYFRFKVMRSHASIELSDVIPILENLGMRVLGEHPYKIRRADGVVVWLHDFELICNLSQHVDVSAASGLFESAFSAIWHRQAESDGFNRLVLSARLEWREVALLRAYCAYMRQTTFTFSQEYIAETLANQVEITRNMVALFKARFDPRLHERGGKNEERVERLRDKIGHNLEGIQNLNEDKILRRYFEFIEATLRTNFFQKTAEGGEKPYLSFKFSPRAIADIPEPKPLYEIYVYSPRMEGVHLRNGKVARGGIRWSDRLQDYRTEILGLVKAQQVKNAVIVPTGAKGGFVAKHLPVAQGREAVQAEGIACYQTLIRGLLDLTDNFVGGELVAPAQTVCHDEPDPYLVVAADKGTATFSDIANQISLEYNHWLGDAFASGGSHGYDHKRMGITARGAWISVQRHFRERGVDVQNEDFTVIGIGDMAGDVFGNGMLLSSHIKLVAAFNHLHIFLDPNPDAQASFAERKRLFELPKSSWADYSPKLISEGGGVFLRTAKSITLSPQIRQVLAIDADKLSPPELISAILKAPVDLLWNGGIGTYVKARGESHAEVGDKANDLVRIDGADLRCRVIGEGGNLGMTQRGRVEYALNGGACNTDFIDNSAGVDCSDHEVNIKILLDKVVSDGDLTQKQRNGWMTDMTEEVAQLVLQNNYRQTFALTLAETQARMRKSEYLRFIRHLESAGKLKPQLEFLPGEDELSERAVHGQGFTRPELAILLCYAKGTLKESLLEERIAQDAYVRRYVETAFPNKLNQAFREKVYQHRLLDEIVATQVANDVVNTLGISAVQRLTSSTAASLKQVAVAFVTVKDIFQQEDFRRYIAALDGQKATALQVELMVNMVRRVRRGTRWFLRNRPGGIDPAAEVEFFQQRLKDVNQSLAKVLTGKARADWQERFDRLQQNGIEEPWLSHLAMLDNLYSGFSVVEVVQQTGCDVGEVTRVFFLLYQTLQLDQFATQLSEMPITSYWQATARENFIDDLDKQLRALTHALVLMPAELEVDKVEHWCENNCKAVNSWLELVRELGSGSVDDFAVFAVAVKKLVDLAQLSLSDPAQQLSVHR